jgi:hypothetical protein
MIVCMSIRCCIQALADKATAEKAVVAVAETKEVDAATLSIDDREVEKLSKEALLYKQAKTLEVTCLQINHVDYM